MESPARQLAGPQRPLDLSELRSRFADRLEAVETAARDWGVRPEYPEGVFISTMIGTQAGFAEVALAIGDTLLTIVERAKATAEDELAKQRVVTERTRQTLTKASGVIENLDRSARHAIEKIEIEKTAVLTQLVRDILPDMTRGVREALVIRERRYNHEREWVRALCIGGLMVGLVLSGYLWGTWSDWGVSSRIESIGIAVERCQVTSRWADDKGNRLCEMKDFSGL
ncbi:hypothetical protein [Acidisphaera sp. L21]|uniref:hypothetical protein n=1 Tax=Acidisphaera sp. L21 TaxID=1641851 RepID=UPI00131CD1E5|nr:hypothetical protein [Acidisphaera sp. L21]